MKTPWQRGAHPVSARRARAAAERRSRRRRRVDSRVAIRLEGNDAEPLSAYERAAAGPRCGARRHVHTHAGVRKDRSYTSYAMNQFCLRSRARARARPRAPASACSCPSARRANGGTWTGCAAKAFSCRATAMTARVAAEGHTLATAPTAFRMPRAAALSPRRGLRARFGLRLPRLFRIRRRTRRRLRHASCGACGTATQNPEWNYVREGPEWWGRRVAPRDAMSNRRATNATTHVIPAEAWCVPCTRRF